MYAFTRFLIHVPVLCISKFNFEVQFWYSVESPIG